MAWSSIWVIWICWLFRSNFNSVGAITSPSARTLVCVRRWEGCQGCLPFNEVQRLQRLYSMNRVGCQHCVSIRHVSGAGSFTTCHKEVEDFRSLAILLHIVCPAGLYSLNSSSCQTCPPGSYCPGGWAGLHKTIHHRSPINKLRLKRSTHATLQMSRLFSNNEARSTVKQSA